jgi:hypothetical protein
MQNLILQPSQDEHFEATIREGRTAAEMSGYLASADVDALRKIYGESPIQVWGITPGASDANVVKWGRLAAGDVACFVKSKRVIYWGVVSHKIHNPELAEHLWGRDHKDQTWEYMYFLRDGEFSGPHMDDINPILGYAAGFSPRGVMVLASDKAAAVIDTFGEFETIFSEDVESSSPTPPQDRDEVRRRAQKIRSPEDLERLLARFEHANQDASVKRKRVVARAIARNRHIADLKKQLHGHRCQICDAPGFRKANGDLYAEAHHLDELAAEGRDVPSNLLCVCPTCHRRIHYGADVLTEVDDRWCFRTSS